MPATNVCELVLDCIETKVNRHSYLTWFKPTVFVADEHDRVLVRVPSPLFRDWLPKHYSAVIDEALREVGRADVTVSFIVEDPGAASHEPPRAEPEAAPTPETQPPITGPAGLNPRYTFDSFIV